MAMVATCLRVARDPFPKDEMCVSEFVHRTLFEISDRTNTESFTNMVTSFKSSDIKLLVAIRFRILTRYDVANALKSVMKKSPDLITDDLPSWLAFHGFGQISLSLYKTALEEAFKYLTSFATQRVLEEALSIVKRNEHYKVNSEIRCCKSQDYIPQDLSGKLNVLLGLVKTRNVLIRDVLTSLPTVIIDLVLGYTTGDIPPNRSISNPKKAARDPIPYLINTLISSHSRTNRILINNHLIHTLESSHIINCLSTAILSMRQLIQFECTTSMTTPSSVNAPLVVNRLLECILLFIYIDLAYTTISILHSYNV